MAGGIVKKYLNTLFITTQGAYVSKEGETVVVSADKQKLLQVPACALGGIICFGNVSCSPFVMGFCAQNGIGISFLTEYGRFLASVHGRINGNVLLRRRQYRMADAEGDCLAIARLFTAGKIYNCRSVLNRALRDHSNKINSQKINAVAEYLAGSIKRAQICQNLDWLRGIEGDAAGTYFSVFNDLILAQKADFKFNDRNRRPPLDNVNCLLSFVYTLLMHDVRSALDAVGLDSCVGLLHCDRPGRPSLALDMMEEWRPVIADRLVLSLINREQLSAKDFKKAETGAVLLSDEGRKTLLTAYQKRKQEEITHPYLQETVPTGLLFYIQALLLARHMRGDIDGYPVFLWK